MIGLLLALSGVAIGIDPDRAPGLLLIGLASTALPWRDAWHGAAGTALRPALIWVALALAVSVVAQLLALTEPLSTGRPMAGRMTYLSVLAILAALISVLNARTPGERVWAGLMVLLVVVFMIPWLEEAGRMRRPQGVILVHLDSPWTLFYGLLGRRGSDELPADSVRHGGGLFGAGLDPGIPRPDSRRLAGPAASRRVGVGGMGVCPQCLGRSLERGPRTGGTWIRRGSGSGSATIGGSSGLCATRNGSIARPSWRGGRSD